MGNGEEKKFLTDADYMLEYDRRKIQDCADVFRNLASAISQQDEKEAPFWPQEESAEEQEEILDRESCMQEENARQSRKSLAAQMKQLAGLLQDVAGTHVQMIRLGARQERQIQRAFASEGLLISDICLWRGKDHKMELSVTACTRRNRSATVTEIAAYLSVLLDMRLVAQKRNPYYIGQEQVCLYFEKEPFYCFMSGAATAVREGERVLGDSFSFLEQDGKVTALLSDGVGSGEQACARSGEVVELAEQILEAGLSAAMTVSLLNSMMRAKMQEEKMSTLDLCCVDLTDAAVRFIKAGAMCSFIRHKESVERVGENTLPLGMEQEEKLTEICAQAESGDLIFMLSDGIVQEWPGEDCLADIEKQIQQIDSESPQDAANRLLRYVITQCRGQIRDDITVLVLGIWENDEKIM